MGSLEEKISSLLVNLETISDVTGSALVSNRGQIMASALHQNVDEKSVAAMAAALTSVAGRVGETLEGGDSKTIVITGKDKLVVVNPLKNATLIALAPANANLGLVQFEIDNTISELSQILD